MDLDTLAKLGEFIGGIVVVVSLAYLAYEVRQNTLSLQSENYARVLDRMSTVQAQLSKDAELHHVFATIGWWLSHPGMRSWWAAKPCPLAADFEAFGDEILRREAYDPAAIARWRGFVAGEGLPPARGGVPAGRA